MANNEIKQKITLEGEKQYKDAIREAQRNLKTLRSELKAETAEMGKNATEQQKATARAKALRKEIAEQEKIVNANRDALEEVKKKYGDNADAVAKYEQQLNNSRTALANMKNELEGLGEGFKKVENDASMAVVATRSMAESFERIGGIGETISGSIETIFGGLMNSVRSVVTEVWDLIAETAAKADRWGDLAGFYGSTGEQIQEVDRAISAAGADFEDFISLMNQLQFKGKDSKLVEWLGISDVNYDNQVEFTLAALGRMSQLKKEIGASRFNDQLGDIFSGKSASLLLLVDKYDQIITKQAEFKEHGYLMDQDEIDTFGEINNTLASIQQKWDALKMRFGEGLGSVTLKIMTNVEGALDALADYFNAETDDERDQALEKMKDNIKSAFEQVAEAIRAGIQVLKEVGKDFEDSDDPILQALGKAISGVADALDWFTKEDNWQKVVHAFEALIGVWAFGKIGMAVGNLTSFAANISTIAKYFGLSGPTQNTPNTQAPQANGGGSGFMTAAKTTLSQAASTATEFMTQNGTVIGVMLDRLLNETFAGRALRDGGDVIEGLKEDVKEFGENIEKNASTFKSDWSNNVLFRSWQWNGENFVRYYQQIGDTLRDAEDYAEQQAEIEQKQLDLLYEQQKSQPTENWEFGEDASIEEQLEWVRQQTQMNNPDWWSQQGQSNGGNAGNTDGMTGADARGMTDAVNRMPAAVQRGMSNIRVIMDSSVVGRLVAGEVSRQIAEYLV